MCRVVSGFHTERLRYPCLATPSVAMHGWPEVRWPMSWQYLLPCIVCRCVGTASVKLRSARIGRSCAHLHGICPRTGTAPPSADRAPPRWHGDAHHSDVQEHQHRRQRREPQDECDQASRAAECLTHRLQLPVSRDRSRRWRTARCGALFGSWRPSWFRLGSGSQWSR